MDTLFADYQLTATRLATLIDAPVREHPTIVARWIEDDQRPSERRNYYRLTHRAIDALHRRQCGVQELRALTDEWRLEAMRNRASREQLTHNVRATTQYLDQHGVREMTVLDRQRLEASVGRVRVTAAPQMFALVGPTPTRLWLDCRETLDEPVAIAKCYVTLWLAQRMRIPAGAVEVIHSASARIVARERLSPSFDRVATAVCEAVFRTWSEVSRGLVVQ